MPKRKRDSTSPPPSSTKGRSLSIRISNLQTTITQGITSLKKALTLARGFERQKLGRRQKAANNEPKTLLKLREEVIVLKQLDLGAVAERQLLKRLGRMKRVSESEAFRTQYGGREWGVVGEAEGNVVARLMGSHPVKELLPGVVERVLGVLGLEGEVGGKRRERERETDLGLQGGVVKATRTQGSELMRAEGDEWSGSESEGEDGMSLDVDPEFVLRNRLESENLVRPETDGSDVDMDGDTDFSGFSARIAASSDDDSEAASSDSDFSNTNTGTRKVTNSKVRPLPKPNLSISRSPSSSPEPIQTRKPKPKPFNPSSTAFLPSLMMGGYYSGSESASDIEDSLNSNKARKNRRGQRARQKIAEAKFGAAAKHIAKEKEGGRNVGRNVGWDPKRGATDGDRNGRFNARGRMRIDSARPAHGNRNGSDRGPTGANGDALGMGGRRKEGTKDKEGPMHPSWDAARKRKEQGSKISIDTSIGKALGRKIVFD